MLNWIWLAFIVVAVLVGGFSGRLPEMTKGAFDTAEVAVMKIALPLIGVWAIWLGMMRLAEQSGLVQVLARFLRPLMRRLFPEVPPEHPAMGAMVLNMAANMLGLGNAATPLGLRAMAHLERLNPQPGVATNAMCTFLAINTASIQLVPTTAIGILAVAGSKNPAAIVPTAFCATLCAAACGVVSAKILEKLPVFRVKIEAGDASERPPIEAVEATVLDAERVHVAPLCKVRRVLLGLFLSAFATMFVLLVFPDFWPGLLRRSEIGLMAFLHSARDPDHGSGLLHSSNSPAPDPPTGLIHALHFPAPPPTSELAGKPAGMRILLATGIVAVPFMLSFFPLYAALHRVRVYEQFVEGAREAFETARRVIPFLVAMLLSISLLRNSGVIDQITGALHPLFDLLHFPADLLPMVLMRPLSGSATQGIFVELVQRFGPDALVSRMAATIYGSTETTFYVIAVYFGSVAVRQTRHAIAAGLLADSVAVIASVILCRMMFSA